MLKNDNESNSVYCVMITYFYLLTYSLAPTRLGRVPSRRDFLMLTSDKLAGSMCAKAPVGAFFRLCTMLLTFIDVFDFGTRTGFQLFAISFFVTASIAAASVSTICGG